MNCRSAIDLMGDAIEGRLLGGLKEDFQEHIEACTPCGVYFRQLCFTQQALALLPRRHKTSIRRSQLVKKFKKELGESEA